MLATGLAVVPQAGAKTTDPVREGEAYAGVSLHRPGVKAAAPPPNPAGPLGVDVSSYQGEIDWPKVRGSGVVFAIVKATEGTTYRNPLYQQQYGGSRSAGLIRGAYHFANPQRTGGAAQADYFVDNGGGWTKDGWTLPGALDVESHPSVPSACYGLSPGQMVGWIGAFSARYQARTGRLPMIYTNPSWWKLCTGNSTAFAANPLWFARWASQVGTLPAGWSKHSFWQYTSDGAVPGIKGRVDRNVFNGGMPMLRGFAARFRTSFQGADATPEPVGQGARLTMAGRLMREGGLPLAGAPVELQNSADGRTWTRVASARTGSQGWVRMRAIARRDGRWRLSFAGTPTLHPTLSAADHLDARKRTVLTLNAAPEPVRKGRPQIVSGRLTRHTGSWTAFGGRQLRVFFRPAGGGRAVFMGLTRTRHDGKFTKRFRARRDGTWWAVFAGGPDALRAVSPGDYVNVR